MIGRTVLVTDGEQRAALAVVRSLGRAGYRVVVGHTDRRALAAASRHASASVLLPSPEHQPDDWLERVRASVRAHDVHVIVPITEPALLAALPAGPRIDDAVLAAPSLAAFEAIRDKESLLARAAALDIAVPAQRVLEHAGHTADGLSFPVVLKPARSVFEHDGMRFKTGVRYARDPDELRRVLEEIPAPAYPVLAQEYIAGPGIGVFGLRWDGARRATFAHRRIREKPPSGGVSVCSQSVPLPEALAEASWRLIESYDWQGVAMVEYKLEAGTGRAVLMEVNGRFWGSLALAIHAGVDFPKLLVDAAAGLPRPPAPTWRAGVRNHWEWGEIDAALIRWRKPDPITGRRAGLVRAFAGTLGLRPGRDRAEVFRLLDPLPFWRETVAWFEQA